MADVKEIMEFWEQKIRGIMEKYGKQERITTDEVQGLCDRLGISLGDLMAAMIVINNLLNNKNKKLEQLVFDLEKENIVMRRKVMELEDRSNMLDKIVEQSVVEDIRLADGRIIKKVNGAKKQQLEVAIGKPIAKKKRGYGDLIDVNWALEQGWDDKMIMDEYGLSRTTLWRRKREIEERRKTGRTLLF